MTICLERFISNLNAVQTIADLHDTLDLSLRRLGFSRFVYLSVRRPSLMNSTYFISNYPEPWIERYTEHRYIDIDPLVLTGAKTVIAFGWEGEKLRHNADPRERTLFDEAREFNIVNGVSAPIHGHGTEFALLTATSDVPSCQFPSFLRQNRHEVTLMALYYHIAVGKRLGDQFHHQTVSLTPREVECLLWTSRGKTAWEISEILRISESTVVFHLNNAARMKLGVYSKHHAVVKAIMLGLILP